MRKIIILLSIVTLLGCGDEESKPDENNKIEWVKYTNLTRFEEDGTEYFQRKTSYDQNGREIESEVYDNKKLNSQCFNYNYNDKNVSYIQKLYGTNGLLSLELNVNKIYLDNHYIKYTLCVQYKPDGTEYNRKEFSYDTQGRETGYRYYHERRLLEMRANYMYNGKHVTYDDYYYYNLDESREIVKREYLDDNYIRFTTSCAYNLSGKEISRENYSYDESGREISHQQYSDGKLQSSYCNYQYKGKEVMCDYESYDKNGYITFKSKTKKIYF